ncbi:MAG UNVERIFIED_CONTAM: hypothetical protein LVT10_22550, partial [Anaerolineae bacterium]|jgi:hypothetical protein
LYFVQLRIAALFTSADDLHLATFAGCIGRVNHQDGTVRLIPREVSARLAARNRSCVSMVVMVL